MAGSIALFIPIVLGTGFFAMIAFICWISARAKQNRARLQAEVQTKLIERFSSGPELAEFLHSPAGKQFVSGVEELPKFNVRNRIQFGITRSIVLSFLGLAFLALCIPEATRDDFFLVAGAICLALGVAFFISTMISMRMSKAWGVTNGPAESNVHSS